MPKKGIKYAIEYVIYKPSSWTENDIDEYMKKMVFFGRCNATWCYENEILFDEANKCLNFRTIKAPKDYIAIKYAIEKIITIPYTWNELQIKLFLSKLSMCANGKSFIWCYDNDELFKG